MQRCNKNYRADGPASGRFPPEGRVKDPLWSGLTSGRKAAFHQRLKKQAGITLVELIISIVIIGIAGTALLQSLGFLTQANVDPMLRSQSNLLAQSMLKEVMGQSFFEPDFDPRIDPTVTPLVCMNPEIDHSGYDRTLWDNICDYYRFNSDTDDNGFSGIRRKDGSPIAGLNGYRVVVKVDRTNSVGLGSGAHRVENTTSCAAVRVLRIDVTVTDPRGQDFILSGYRTSYWNEGC